MFKLTQSFVLAALAASALGAVYTDPSQVSNKTYDFVVIGAGTAGNVIVNRLSANPAVKVLVIEAGGTDTGYDSVLLQVPFFGPLASVNTPFDWNYTTTPQQALNNQSIAYSRGFVLGGSSSTNFMAWTRGSSEDFNRWGTVIGNTVFSWNNLLAYFKKSETHVRPADGRDDTGEYNPAVHGTSGPVLSSVSGDLTDIDDRVLNTAKAVGSEFPFNLDTNSGNAIGVAWQESSIGNGVRSSSSTAYLTPALKRTNVDLLMNTRVTKLVRTGTSSGLPEFKSVEVAKDSASARITFNATKEIVLSAGAIGTPQILMLSGVGNSADLAAVGIKSIVSLPEVGQNLQDHPVVSLQWNVVGTANTFDSLSQSAAAMSAAQAQYANNRTGKLVSAGGNHLGFFRIPAGNALLSKGDWAAGPTTPHYELGWQNGFVSVAQPFPTTGRYLSSICVVNSPTSRGFVKLASSDPFAAPTIDPKLLTTDIDMGTMIYAVRAGQRFTNGTAWNGYITGPYTDSVATFGSNATDSDIIAYIRKWTASIKHPAGTAAANKAAGKGVIDSNLLVKNLKGVRVVDASAFPYIPSAHLQASVYALAEAAADIIKKAYSV